MGLRSDRLSAKKKKSLADSAEKYPVLSVKFISDNDVTKVIHEKEKKSLVRSGKGRSKRSLNKQSLERAIYKESGIEEPNKNHRTQNITPGKKRGRRKTVMEEVESSSEEEEDELDIKERCEKPYGLCDDDDVAGNEMCSFRTPKKKQGMYQKALESAGKIKSSGTPSKTPSRVLTPSSASRLSSRSTPNKITSKAITPSSSSRITPRTVNKRTQSLSKNPSSLSKTETNSVTLSAQTPYNLRAKNKKAIQNHMRTLTAVDDDAEDSDYRGSEDSSDESEGSDSSPEKEDSSSDSGKGSEEPRPHCRRSLRFQQPQYTKRKYKDANYVFTADEYFESQGGKCKTSDHRLSRLQTPRLDSLALQDLLSNCSESRTHNLGDKLCNDTDMFERWMFALSQGFSILTYGLGSKYKILQNFHRKMLSGSHVLVVNGFFPSLNIKEIVEMIAQDLLGLRQVLPSSHSVIDWIESRRNMPRVFLIVHNVDAEPLRCDKTQSILSRLASLPRIHLVASVDHINCPLLWDQARLSNFNFMWEDVTSFLPFQEETSYETSLMVQNSGSLALSSLLSVYRSLTLNSRGVFRIILEKHLEQSNQKYTGMAFSDLYKKCRDEMLVTNDMILRTMLTEFLDHQMVKWRRDTEHLYIPVETGVLQQFHKKIIQDS